MGWGVVVVVHSGMVGSVLVLALSSIGKCWLAAGMVGSAVGNAIGCAWSCSSPFPFLSCSCLSQGGAFCEVVGIGCRR